jgi:hypothetical protein
MNRDSTSFMSLIIVGGALHTPKGITNHSYKPYLVFHIVLHMSSTLILTWW